MNTVLKCYHGYDAQQPFHSVGEDGLLYVDPTYLDFSYEIPMVAGLAMVEGFSQKLLGR